MTMRRINPGDNYLIVPGDHFTVLLPDGTLLNVEQTQDDFSIVRGNGLVACTKPTSGHAIAADEVKLGDESQQTTGRN